MTTLFIQGLTGPPERRNILFEWLPGGQQGQQGTTLWRNISIDSVSVIEEMANLWLTPWTARNVRPCLTSSD